MCTKCYVSSILSTWCQRDCNSVTICRYYKMAIFILFNRVGALKTMELFFQLFLSHLSFLYLSFFYENSHFLGHYWQTLPKILGCQLKFLIFIQRETVKQMLSTIPFWLLFKTVLSQYRPKKKPSNYTLPSTSCR